MAAVAEISRDALRASAPEGVLGMTREQMAPATTATETTLGGGESEAHAFHYGSAYADRGRTSEAYRELMFSPSVMGGYLVWYNPQRRRSKSLRHGGAGDPDYKEARREENYLS